MALEGTRRSDWPPESRRRATAVAFDTLPSSTHNSNPRIENSPPSVASLPRPNGLMPHTTEPVVDRVGADLVVRQLVTTLQQSEVVGGDDGVP